MLEERNTYTPADIPQVWCNCDPVLNRDPRGQSKLSSDLSVLDLKTSSNSPKWTDLIREKQNLRVSAKSKSTKFNKSNKYNKSKLDSIQDFNRYTKGMTFSEKQKYLMMSEEEKAKIRQNILEKEKSENDKIEKLLKDKSRHHLASQISVMVLNMRGKPLDPCSPAKAKKLLKQNKAKVIQRCPFTIQLKYPTGEARQPLKLGLDPGYKTVGFSIINKKREVLSGEVILRTDIPERLIEKKMYRTNRRSRNTRYREPRWKNRGNKKGKKKGWLPPSNGLLHLDGLSRGGTDRISNLTISCHDCNQEKGNKTAAEFGHPEIQNHAKQSLKAAAFMNIVRQRLIDNIKENFPNLYVDSTYGYVTKYNRKKLGLEKTHVNDAFVIAGGNDQIRSKPYEVKQTRRNDRSLQTNRKGHKPSIKRQRYKFKPGDLIKRKSLLSTSGWGEKRDKKDTHKSLL